MFLMRGLVEDFNFAARMGDGRILSTQMYLPMPPARTTLANFFSPQAHHIEQMILNGEPSYPIERTLLTTGLVVAAVESLHLEQKRVETPYLDVRYTAPEGSTFWND